MPAKQGIWVRARIVLIRIRLGSIALGILYALRTAIVLLVFTALVVTPVVLADSGVVFSAKAIGESSVWAFLVVNGAPPQLGAATFTLIPWGLALLPWWINYVAARTLAARYQHRRGETIASILALFFGYVAVVAVAAVFVESINVSYSVVNSVIAASVLTGSAMLAGIFRIHSQSIPIPMLVVFVVRRAIAAVFALFGVAALIMAVLFLIHFSDVLMLFNGLDPGFSGFLALTVLSIGYLPVLTVWTIAYIVGAGFTIGPDVIISPFIAVTAPTQLPPFPPLALLPEQSGAISWLLPLVVIFIGVVWGIGISLQLARENILIRLVVAVAVAIVAAVVVMGLAALSLGDLGDVRLVDLGPSPTLVGSLTWLLLVVGMTPAAMIPAKVFQRKRRPKISVVSE
jgi:hypothetical protein